MSVSRLAALPEMGRKIPSFTAQPLKSPVQSSWWSCFSDQDSFPSRVLRRIPTRNLMRQQESESIAKSVVREPKGVEPAEMSVFYGDSPNPFVSAPPRREVFAACIGQHRNTPPKNGGGSDIDAAHPQLRSDFQRFGVDLHSGTGGSPEALWVLLHMGTACAAGSF